MLLDSLPFNYRRFYVEINWFETNLAQRPQSKPCKSLDNATIFCCLFFFTFSWNTDENKLLCVEFTQERQLQQWWFQLILTAVTQSKPWSRDTKASSHTWSDQCCMGLLGMARRSGADQQQQCPCAKNWLTTSRLSCIEHTLGQESIFWYFYLIWVLQWENPTPFFTDIEIFWEFLNTVIQKIIWVVLKNYINAIYINLST